MLYKYGKYKALKTLGLSAGIPAAAFGSGHAVLGEGYSPAERFARGAGVGALTGGTAYGTGKGTKELLNYAFKRSLNRRPRIPAKFIDNSPVLNFGYTFPVIVGTYGGLTGFNVGTKLTRTGTHGPKAKKERSERARKNREKKQQEKEGSASTIIKSSPATAGYKLKSLLNRIDPLAKDIGIYGGGAGLVGAGVSAADTDNPTLSDIAIGAGKGSLVGMGGLAGAHAGPAITRKLLEAQIFSKLRNEYGRKAVWKEWGRPGIHIDDTVPDEVLLNLVKVQARRQHEVAPVADVLGTGIGAVSPYAAMRIADEKKKE